MNINDAIDIAIIIAAVLAYFLTGTFVAACTGFDPDENGTWAAIVFWPIIISAYSVVALFRPVHRLSRRIRAGVKWGS